MLLIALPPRNQPCVWKQRKIGAKNEISKTEMPLTEDSTGKKIISRIFVIPKMTFLGYSANISTKASRMINKIKTSSTNSVLKKKKENFKKKLIVNKINLNTKIFFVCRI